MSGPRRAQWSKKVRARQHKTMPMAHGHGLKKGLNITLNALAQASFHEYAPLIVLGVEVNKAEWDEVEQDWGMRKRAEPQ